MRLRIRSADYGGLKAIAIGLASLAAFLLVWEAVFLAINNPFFLPGPYQVFIAFIRIATLGDINHVPLAVHAAVSLYRVLLGFVAGAVTAVPLGLLMGMRTTARYAATPILEPLRFIPPLAWIPLTILLFGLNGFIFIIWLGVFFPVLLNTIAGVRRTSITLINVAKTFGANDLTILRKIILPSALPEIMTGLRVGMGIGWMCLVAAELIIPTAFGLGYLIQEYFDFAQTDGVIVGMITIGLIGMAINYIMLYIEKRMFRWRVEVGT